MGLLSWMKGKRSASPKSASPRTASPGELHDPLTHPRVVEDANPYAGPGHANRMGNGALSPTAKYGIAGGMSGAAAGSTFGATLAGAGMSAASSLGTSAGAEMGGLLGLGDAAMTWKNANKRIAEGERDGDQGSVALGEQLRSEAQMGVANGVISGATTGLKFGAVAEHGAQAVLKSSDFLGTASAGSSYAITALGAASAATGIAGGALGLAQAGYQGAKAVGRYRKASGAELLSTKGKSSWRPHIKGKSARKGMVQALKAVGAGLGIAAGILALASNPVGWALGIGAACIGMGVLAGKMYSGIKDNSKRAKKRKELESQGKITKFAKPKKPAKKAWYKRAAASVGNLFKSKNKPAEEAPDLAAEDIAAEGLEDVEADENLEEAGEEGEDSDEAAKRERAKRDADVLAEALGGSAAVAAEMIRALEYTSSKKHSEAEEAYLQQFPSLRESANKLLENPGVKTAFSAKEKDHMREFSVDQNKIHEDMSEKDREKMDAETLVGVLGVTVEQATSASGQELLEKRMSALEGA